MKTLATIFASLFIASAACAGEQHGGRHGKHGVDDRKTTQTTSVIQSSRSESSAQSRASAKSRAKANSEATGGTGTGGNAVADGGQATATGGQVVIGNAGGGSWLTGRMVPDVSAGAPITSTSCRNGISAGGSGNGWGGLLGFFAEDDLCEWRLLEANYRATGDNDAANAIRRGMTAQRCKKLAPEDREAFGDLCPKQPAAGQQNVAFSSAG